MTEVLKDEIKELFVEFNKEISENDEVIIKRLMVLERKINDFSERLKLVETDGYDLK